MSRSPIKVVFFDAGGTLFHVKGSVAEVYLHYAEKYGVVSTPELKASINKAFAEAFAHAPPPIFAVSQPTKLKQCERLWWFDIVHAVFYRVGMFNGFDEYFDEVFEAFAGATHWTVDPDLLPLLKDLKGQGYELGIISNFDTRLFSILAALSLRSLFDSVTISSLVQATKPSQQIFHYALNEHVVDPHEALHVGDSFNEDWKGAIDAGLHGVLLSSVESSPVHAVSIQKLHQLPAIISKIGH
ncbi:MAG: HAD-IA family hydrolase, partial [Nitrospirales bacterium]